MEDPTFASLLKFQRKSKFIRFHQLSSRIKGGEILTFLQPHLEKISSDPVNAKEG